jgi:very-short-patch-repair endonuclease
MDPQTTQAWPSGLWTLAKNQHGVVTRRQLLGLGLSTDSIKHRVAKGRLHPLWRGVYAVGRPQLGRHGMWMAAVLSCGSGAALSHESAAALWGIRPEQRGPIEVSIRVPADAHRSGILVHRRATLGPEDLTRRHGIPVTTPVCTLVDLASHLRRDPLEAAVNEADKQRLVDAEVLRSALDRLGRRPGAAALRRTLDRRTFTLTDSQLERRFLPLARKAGLSQPQTGRRINGFKVDFYWPDLGLVVETDGLRYHRTPAQQARDRLRDQAHAAAGLMSLRFTRAQVTFEPGHVQATLAAVACRIRADRARLPSFR